MEQEKADPFMGYLLEQISEVPYAEELGIFIKNLVILTKEQPVLGKEALDHFAEYFDDLIERYNGGPLLLSKGQYIAVVGDSYIKSQSMVKIFSEYGIAKSSVKNFTDFKKYKSGEYSNALNSPQCVAVIIGPVSHSARDMSDKGLSEKFFYARSKSSQLKLTKESLKEILEEVVDFLTKKNSQN